MRIPIWDLPIRIFHWALAFSVISAIVTAVVGGNWIVWHGRLGLVIIGLLTFRVMWGFFGSHCARFTQFFPTPGKIIAYMSGQWKGEGHNPLGAVSVFGLLTVLMAQAVMGLFTNDDIAFFGPLADLVSADKSSQLTQWHSLNAYTIYVLVGLHMAAIVFYRVVKKNDLIRPMILGWKAVDKNKEIEIPVAQLEAQMQTRGSWLGFIVSFAVALAAVYAASGLWKPAPPPPPPAAVVETPNF